MGLAPVTQHKNELRMATTTSYCYAVEVQAGKRNGDHHIPEEMARFQSEDVTLFPHLSVALKLEPPISEIWRVSAMSAVPSVYNALKTH